jgi:transposase
VPKPFRDSDPDATPGSERQPRSPTGGERTVETVPKRRRRVFSAADKLRIVKEADRCLASGKRGALGAMLRREGIYSSLVSSWRTQLGAHGTVGLAAQRLAASRRSRRLNDSTYSS